LTEKPKGKKSRFEKHTFLMASKLEKVIAQESEQAHKKDRNNWEDSFHLFVFLEYSQVLGTTVLCLLAKRALPRQGMTETNIFPSNTIGYCEKAFNGDLSFQHGVGPGLPALRGRWEMPL
jgi:hypothetical protein